MKTLSTTLLSLTALVIIISSCSCKKHVDPPTPPVVTYTVSYNANGGTGSTASQPANSGSSITISANGFSFTDYTFVSWNTAANGTGTSYAPGSSLTVTSNVTLYAIWKSAYTAVFTAADASSSALLKSLPGNSSVKALVLNVTTAGLAKLDCIGSLTNGNPALASYWITNKDSVEVFQSTSTLNPVVAKTSMLASQTINLSVGVNVICFKTAAYSSTITNGTPVGVKVTGASGNTISNASYTADAVSANVANVVKIYLKQGSGAKASANLQTTNFGGGDLQIIPYNDEAGSIYDANMYPSINFLSFDTKNTSWISSATGYPGLDFTNALGSAGRNFVFAQDNNGPISNIFTNSDAIFSSGILQFSKSGGVKLLKSILGNFSYCATAANVYNPTSVQFGPASICWYLKSIRFTGNPELWIYDPNGTRIW